MSEKVKVDKQIIKIVIHKKVVKILTPKKLSPMKSTKHEQDNAEKRKAEKAKELYNSMEAKQIQEGAIWIERVDRFGKKSMVLSKQ